MWALKNTTNYKLVNITKKKQIHKYKKQTSGYQWGERMGEGQFRGRELRGTIDSYSLFYT